MLKTYDHEELRTIAPASDSVLPLSRDSAAYSVVEFTTRRRDRKRQGTGALQDLATRARCMDTHVDRWRQTRQRLSPGLQPFAVMRAESMSVERISARTSRL